LTTLKPVVSTIKEKAMANENAAVEGGMTFGELLENRRSIRRYQNRPVPVQVVREMIHESTLAPSAGNEQPWRFVIVHDREVIEKISDESKKNILARIAANPEDYAKKYERMLQKDSFNVFYNAPCLLMILGQSTLKNLSVDCALAACYFMMAAASRGLGTCWVNLGAEIYDPELRKELGRPDNCAIVAPITLGYPEKIPPTPKRKEPKILSIIAP
jgi:nitroreductase